MAGKKFTTKGYRLRARAEVREQKLKIAPKTFGLKESVEQKNHELILSLEKKVAEAQKK